MPARFAWRPAGSTGVVCRLLREERKGLDAGVKSLLHVLGGGFELLIAFSAVITFYTAAPNPRFSAVIAAPVTRQA